MKLMLMAEKNPSGTHRLQKLRKLVTQLIREERVEWAQHHAFEARPYVERVCDAHASGDGVNAQLLQLAIEDPLREDDYSQSMLDWWLIERDLLFKVYGVLVPRYSDAYNTGRNPRPFTRVIPLPAHSVGYFARSKEQWRTVNPAVVELRGACETVADATVIVQAIHIRQ
jgi:ribosomal protein L17